MPWQKYHDYRWKNQLYFIFDSVWSFHPEITRQLIHKQTKFSLSFPASSGSTRDTAQPGQGFEPAAELLPTFSILRRIEKKENERERKKTQGVSERVVNEQKKAPSFTFICYLSWKKTIWRKRCMNQYGILLVVKVSQGKKGTKKNRSLKVGWYILRL